MGSENKKLIRESALATALQALVSIMALGHVVSLIYYLLCVSYCIMHVNTK